MSISINKAQGSATGKRQYNQSGVGRKRKYLYKYQKQQQQMYAQYYNSSIYPPPSANPAYYQQGYQQPQQPTVAEANFPIFQTPDKKRTKSSHLHNGYDHHPSQSQQAPFYPGYSHSQPAAYPGEPNSNYLNVPPNPYHYPSSHPGPTSAPQPNPAHPTASTSIVHNSHSNNHNRNNVVKQQNTYLGPSTQNIMNADKFVFNNITNNFSLNKINVQYTTCTYQMVPPPHQAHSTQSPPSLGEGARCKGGQHCYDNWCQQHSNSINKSAYKYSQLYTGSQQQL